MAVSASTAAKTSYERQKRRLGEEELDAWQAETDAKNAHRITQVRDRIETTLRSALGDDSLMIDRDVRDFMKGISDDALEEGRLKTTEEKLKALEDMEKYAAQFASEARQFGRQYFQTVRQAVAEQALSERSAAKLLNKEQMRKGDWTAVKKFMENGAEEKSFIQWSKNWKAVAQNLKDVKERQKQLNADESTIPALAALDGEEFQSGSFARRKAIIEAALDALIAYEYQHHPLYEEATEQLAAVTGTAVSARIAQNWLTYTFKQKSPDKLEQFVTVKLLSLIKDWQTARKRFDVLAKQGKMTLSAEEFIGLHYWDRMQELEKAEGGTEAAEAVTPLDKAGKAINAQQWDKAAAILAGVDEELLEADERFRLQNMLRYIEQNQEKDPEEVMIRGKSTADLLQQEQAMYQTIYSCPAPIQKLYLAALHEGEAELRCAMVGTFNVEWAYRHRFLDKEILFDLRNNAMEDTEQIKEEGHRERGVENLHAAAHGDGDQVFRPFEDASVGATYVHYDERSSTNVMQDIRNRCKSFKHNYWILYPPYGVPLEDIIETVKIKHPLIKAGLFARRILKQRASLH